MRIERRAWYQSVNQVPTNRASCCDLRQHGSEYICLDLPWTLNFDEEHFDEELRTRMGALRAIAAGLALLLSVILYRGQHSIFNSILVSRTFPAVWTPANLSSPCTYPLLDPDLRLCEDAVLDGDRVLVSCDRGRFSWNTATGPMLDPTSTGSLWLYKPSARSITRLTITEFPVAHVFHPVGLALRFPDAYVVNQGKTATTIEHLHLDEDGTARWLRTLSFPSQHPAPNALALTPDGTGLYVSNDKRFTPRVSPILSHLETLSSVPLGWVGFINTTTGAYTRAAQGLVFPNGVSVSPDGLHVAVAESAFSRLHIYARDPLTNALEWETVVQLPAIPDNVHYAGLDRVVVGGIPWMPSMDARRQGKGTTKAAAWVMEVLFNQEDEKWEQWDGAPVNASSVTIALPEQPAVKIRTLMQSNGEVIEASTGASYDPERGEVYVAGLADTRGFVVCKV
ncbi:calcium-dependent phosphotriesterase [Cylindrobasidium torrendii FP15055 ss-10]|uniref:Calcium-dependent phosphotriesterase n=1 Tax=Cylindrobasidium torrendii FP15055 ss-10 TaxID=1314674 RepID=A0A0D7B575_9AGAR|nr:calcium-dependent phosphotriesterase [Cylindrobasidium torrendii FP15055 ss-10]